LRTIDWLLYYFLIRWASLAAKGVRSASVSRVRLLLGWRTISLEGIVSKEGVRFKAHPTIGACGIDCGMCPRYQTDAASRCPGCVAPGFLESGGQWCKISRCAVRDSGYETCADCVEFPCYRLDGWDEADSFVSHLRSLSNLRAIRDRGMEAFLEQQGERMRLLGAMLRDFDEGRSKSYCCRAAALLPIDELDRAVKEATGLVGEAAIAKDDRKAKARALHETLDAAAERLGISLRLRRSER